MAGTYKVSGDRTVAGKVKGETLSEKDLEGSNVLALIEGGHLTSAAAEAPAPKEGK